MDSEYIKGIIGHLKEVRVKKQLSQSKLAAKIGIKQSHISKIESGKINPTLGSMIEIARVLDFELMLIPKKYTRQIETLLQAHATHSTSIPAYTLKDEGGEDA